MYTGSRLYKTHYGTRCCVNLRSFQRTPSAHRACFTKIALPSLGALVLGPKMALNERLLTTVCEAFGVVSVPCGLVNRVADLFNNYVDRCRRTKHHSEHQGSKPRVIQDVLVDLELQSLSKAMKVLRTPVFCAAGQSVTQQSGMRAGLFLSPHTHTLTVRSNSLRFQIDREPTLHACAFPLWQAQSSPVCTRCNCAHVSVRFALHKDNARRCRAKVTPEMSS